MSAKKLVPLLIAAPHGANDAGARKRLHVAALEDIVLFEFGEKIIALLRHELRKGRIVPVVLDGEDLDGYALRIEIGKYGELRALGVDRAIVDVEQRMFGEQRGELRHLHDSR